MLPTAMIDRCTQLESLTHWRDTKMSYAIAKHGNYTPWLRETSGESSAYVEVPAYDLGYVRAKLMQVLMDKEKRDMIVTDYTETMTEFMTSLIGGEDETVKFAIRFFEKDMKQNARKN